MTTLGIGVPGDIEHFILVGLSAPITPGFIDTDARRRFVDFDVDERVSASMADRLGDLDVDERVSTDARKRVIELDMDNRDD